MLFNKCVPFSYYCLRIYNHYSSSKDLGEKKKKKEIQDSDQHPNPSNPVGVTQK